MFKIFILGKIAKKEKISKEMAISSTFYAYLSRHILMGQRN